MNRLQSLAVGCAALVALTAGPAPAAEAPRTLDELAAVRRAELLAVGFAPRALGDGGGRVAWLETGDGPPLVFLHGAGDQAATWHAVAPAFTASYRVVLVDLPGHGASEPLAAEVLPMATVVAGAERVLLAATGGPPAIVVGNSMGAWIATLLAHRHPARVARLVLVSGGALPGDPGAPSLVPATREQAAYLMSKLRDPASPPLPEWILDDIVRRTPSGATTRMMRDLPGLVGHLLVGRLGEVSTPVDLLWGESDQLMTLAYAERMASQLPSARLTRIARCGHVPQVECPERFRAALADLLAAPPPIPDEATAP
ncbi:MAG TPA: alpha/beta hydrolase [Thermoanaerobaculia bacterium]|jgi:pimeloyl-ACP methyl ester carboxylesterase